MTGKTAEVIVASIAVRRLVKVMTNKITQNLGPFLVCFKLSFEPLLVSSKALETGFVVVVSCCDIVLRL